jgi:23S rRNA pseudouridine2605 synthase
VRLQTYLARSGAAPSRRTAEALISAGRVRVNGERATLGMSVAPEDTVLLDGRPVHLPEEHAYLALNKPAGYLTTLQDEPGRDRPTVATLMPRIPGLVPAGRLDAATTGLLLLTTDGALANRVTHPSSEIEKEYLVAVRGRASERALDTLRAGPDLEDGPMLPPELTDLRRSPRETTFRLTIHEGRNRIIRRACAAVGLEVIRLTRLRVGPAALGDLPEGRTRRLTEREVNILRGHV